MASKPFRDTSDGGGLDVRVTLPAGPRGVVDKIKELAKERGETFSGWCRAELIAAVEAPGSDDRIRAVLDAATAAARRGAAGRLTDSDWERIAEGVELSPAELEAAAEVEMERRARAGPGPGGRVVRGGSWCNEPRVLLSANRVRHSAGSRKYTHGFRVARVLTS